MKNKKDDVRFLLKIVICLALLFIIFLLNNASSISFAKEEAEFCYLSDIPYVTEQSSVGWREISLDKTPDNTALSVKVEGSNYTFEKGIFAHATSTVVYDLTDYAGYDYFTAYLGLNTTSTRGDGVTFDVFTSSDGTNWESQLEDGPIDKQPGQNATFVKIDIRNVKFLKLYADDKASNASDHSVYADAKLTKATYNDGNVVTSIQEYDKKIKAYANPDLSNPEFELLVLQRNFVNKAGQYALNRFASESEANKQTLSWLMNNLENLRLYMLGGTPEGGSYYNSLTQLSRLYDEYSSDFTNNELLNNTWYPDMTYGYLYKKMAISLSLTHSQTVGLWMQPGPAENKSDALSRYAIFKYMHKNGKLRATDTLDITPWFEALQVEEMRFVMNNAIDDEEILWLNAYVQTKLDQYKTTNYLTPHPYMAYVYPNYQNPVYYAEENKQYFNELFAVNGTGLFDLKYTIPGGKNTPTYNLAVTRGTPDYKLYKVWMNFRNKFGTGAVCGGISKSGSNIRTTHGIPATVIGQPGHAALLYYTKDAQGRGYWNIDNDVSGWTLSEKGERLLMGWGNANTNYARGSYQVVYMALAQEALNDYTNFEKCEEMVLLANSYQGDLAKQEEIYRKALKIQPINLDAWLGLINVYNANESKTENEYFDLAKELAENLKYFPLPMQQLTNLIKPHLTTIENQYRFTLLQTRILTEGSQTPNNTADNYYVYQPSLTRLEANYLLGKLDKTIATFSFDGDDANKIVLSSRFDGNGVRWDYSLDGKQTWNEVSFTAEEEHKLQLTPQQIASITSENDIYVHIVGVNYDEENLYKIDIQESSGLPATLYANDLENKLMAAVPAMQWKYREEDNWTFYRDEEPNLTGDKSVIVRMGATGVYLASTTSSSFTFTQDNLPQNRQYVPISHLSIHGVSTEATNQQGAATFAIDGNANTRYHSAWNGSDTERYMTIKLDEPVYLSAVEFIPAGGGNGKIYDGTIYGSMDGENWEILSRQTNLSYTNQANTVEDAIANTKAFEVDNPTKVQYVKIVADRTNGNWFAARMFNFYEDKTVKTSVKFSFDGENAGKIMLEDKFENANWSYSIDGGTTWKSARGKSYQLPNTEIEQINETNKIKVRFEGDVTEYTIHIKTGTAPEITPYVNDLENRLIGLNNVSTLEWKLASESNWKSYVEQEPIVTGNNTLLVRTKGTGVYTPSTSLEYAFTADNQPDTAKYIPIKHLSVHGYSTQSVDSGRPFYAPNAIDGNRNTLWHTDFRYSVLEQEGNPFITIKLDEPKYISALEFVQKKYRTNDPDSIKNAIVFVSMDGENWTEAGRKENCEQNEEFKRIEFSESVQAQYVKFDMETYGIFASAAMINLFEDITKREEPVIPTADIQYNITETTNQNVTATLVNPSTEITVTNNGGSTSYTFTENGTFTFEFTDKAGNKGTATATVTWIDKKAPVATITYSTQDTTSENVTATITFDKTNVTITNNSGNNTYTFTENGTFTFEFVDKAGNTGTSTATVTWIEKEPDVPVDPDKPDVPEGITSEIYKIETAFISKIAPQTTVSQFKGNVVTEQEMWFLNKDGSNLGEDSILATGMTLKVGSTLQFTLIVAGDINGDGNLSVTDFAKLKLHLIEEKLLTGNELKAADVNCNGDVTVTDLAKMKLQLIN